MQYYILEKLERDGFEVTYLPVDQRGRVAVEDVQKPFVKILF